MCDRPLDVGDGGGPRRGLWLMLDAIGAAEEVEGREE